MLKNFLKAGFGSVGAQAINLAALPIISRLYAPEEYAVWAIVIATAMIFGGVACLRYEVAIVLPDDQDDASALFLWSIGSSALMAALVAGVGVLLIVTGFVQIGEGEVAYHYTLLAPLLVAMTGFTLALQYWAIRQEAYALNSGAQIGLAATTLAVQFYYALVYGGHATGLIAGSLVGQVIAVATLAAGCLVSGNRPIISATVLGRVLPVIREHYRFPLYSMPYSLFGTIRERASVYVIALFLSSREVGLYALAYRIMNFPVSLISAALRPVVFKESSVQGVAALENRVNRILHWLALLATPMVVVYFYWSEEIFALVFGTRWRDAALYGEFFALPVFTFMFCNWMDRIMDVIGQQRLTMTLEIVFGSLSVLSLWAAFAAGLGLIYALGMQCAVLIAYNVSYLVLAYDRASYAMAPLLRHLGLIVVVSAATAMTMELVF